MPVRWAQAPGVVARNVAGELVLVSTASTAGVRNAGDFFVLNDTAELLWRTLADEPTPEQMAQRLIDEFGIDESQALADAGSFLDAAQTYGVVVTLEGS